MDDAFAWKAPWELIAVELCAPKALQVLRASTVHAQGIAQDTASASMESVGAMTTTSDLIAQSPGSATRLVMRSACLIWQGNAVSSAKGSA